MKDFDLALKLAELYDAADKSEGTPTGLNEAEAALFDFLMENFQQIINALQRR